MGYVECFIYEIGGAINQHYLSIPQYTGSWGNRFYETHGITCQGRSL